MVRKRIGYIDAMRGFTMILVVYSHVCNYCLGNKWMGWNDVFFLFRMPCFFFISGWLFEPVRESIRAVVKKKFMVQIIPTVIFLLLLAPPPPCSLVGLALLKVAIGLPLPCSSSSCYISFPEGFSNDGVGRLPLSSL